MSAFMQSWGQLVANLSSTGAMSVLLWTVWGPTSSILEPTSAQIRLYSCLLALLWSHLTVNLGQPSATWSRSKGIWNRVGANLGRFGVNLGRRGAGLWYLGKDLVLISVILITTWVRKARTGSLVIGIGLLQVVWPVCRRRIGNVNR